MSFRRSTTNRFNRRLLIATQERDAEREAAKELYDLATKEIGAWKRSALGLLAECERLEQHPFRNLWNWLMGRQ